MSHGTIDRPANLPRQRPVMALEQGRLIGFQPALDAHPAVAGTRPLRRPPTRRERLGAAFLPATLTGLTAAIVLAQQPDLAILLTIVGVALVGLGFALQDDQLPADAIVLVGQSPMAAVIASSIAGRPNRARRGPAILRAHNLAEAATLVRSARCDKVIVADAAGPRPADLIDARGHRPALVPGAEKIEALLGRVPLELAVQDRGLARLGPLRAFHPAHAGAKRVMDLAVAAGLGFIVLPLLPLIALAIRIDSRGPVFYNQQRVGRCMRLTRLNELPRLWNVLKGEMTLVGPRPERPEFPATLAGDIPGYDLRILLRTVKVVFGMKGR